MSDVISVSGRGRYTNRFRELWRDPGEIPRALWLSVGYRVALLLKRLVLSFGGRPAGGFLGRLLEKPYEVTKKYLEGQATVAFATTRFNSLAIEAAKREGSKRALVFLLRGQIYYPHNLHNYLVGCALRELGYAVSFVYCGGEVECCGVNQNGPESLAGPPVACNFCKGIAQNISVRGFDIINLNDYRVDDDEEHAVLEIARQPPARLFDSEFNGIRLGEAVNPFLMRFFFGDYRKIRPTNPAVVDHFKSAARFLLRFNNLLDQVKPSCLCFFNGLFFPESLFIREAARRGIPSLFAERGMRKNTIFLSLNDPACHYRSDQLWDHVNHEITKDQIETAKAYLADRMKGPEDPMGVRRNISDNVNTKYKRLAEIPYVLFYAPVVHDTASMEKDDVTGGVFQALKRLCLLAVEERQRLVVRSHPDERSEHNPSHYPIREYLADEGLLHDEYVVCLDSSEVWDPYLLAENARGIVIFNGTLGMELPALGYEVFNVCASNYTGKGFTNDIMSLEDFRTVFKSNRQRLSSAQREMALKYFYYYVFVANISVDTLLDEKPLRFDLVQGVSTTDQRVQIDSIKHRVEFLLSSYLN